MKLKCFLLLLVGLSAIAAYAQTDESRKFNEADEIYCDGSRAFMDGLLTELNQNESARGYVMVYQGNVKKHRYDRKGQYAGFSYTAPRRGFDREVIGFFKEHLKFRKFPAERIVFVQAGFRERFAVELWMVPERAVPPSPMPTLKSLKQSRPVRSKFGFCGGM